jgi:Lysylphosphatidylglycerol synthase TM region
MPSIRDNTPKTAPIDPPAPAAAADARPGGGARRRAAAPPWFRRVHAVALAVLAAATIWGIRKFLAGDANALAAMWDRTVSVLPWVFALAAADVAIEALAWTLVFERFGLRARDPVGFAVAVAGKAGLLLPAQLGRLLRPDLMVRLGRGSLGESLKAEAATFLLDSASVVALLAALAGWWLYPPLAPVAGAAVIAVCLALANRIAPLLSGTALAMPRRFWWSWKTVGIVVLQSCGWAAHGLAFWVLARVLDGSVRAWDALFWAPASAVLGVGSGLPGGLGATELVLGMSLGIHSVPEAQLALGVGFFRVFTFWVWLPVGWLAVAAASVAARRRERRGTPPEIAVAAVPAASGVAEEALGGPP